jgi:hypothetical protein
LFWGAKGSMWGATGGASTPWPPKILGGQLHMPISLRGYTNTAGRDEKQDEKQKNGTKSSFSSRPVGVGDTNKKGLGRDQKRDEGAVCF